MKTIFLSATQKLSLPLLAIGLFSTLSASAATEHWIGPTTDSNWTTAGNWSAPQQTYFNDVDFIDNGGNTNLSVFTVDNVFASATGVAQCPIYMLRMYPTNRNFTTLIDSGVALYTGAGTGDLYAGGDTITTSRGIPNIQETISFVGTNALLAITGTLHVGQGLGTTTNNTSPPSAQYVTLNLSGLDNFAMMPSISGGTRIQGITVGNTASGTAGSRFLLCGQIRTYSQGAIYLAKTNIILLGNDMEIGAMSIYSNSMPCPVYLGISNSILVGNNGAANGLVTVGSRGCTNASLTFNPAFLGGSTPPTASFASPAAINGGRITTFYISLATGGVIPTYAYADFTGGNVNVMASTLQIGTASSNGVNALGTLTMDNGVFNVNNVTNGFQTVSAGGTGVGTINLNSNATYGTSATMVVNNALVLGAATGTTTPGTAGTLNVNGATLVANSITNGGGAATVNMTNANWQTALANGFINMNLTTSFSASGSNIITITSIPLFLSGSLPLRFHLIAAPTITGAATLGLGPLPASYNSSIPYAGHLDYTTTPGIVDFVLAAAPPSPAILTWSGTNASGLDGNWDTNSVDIDWLANGFATSYSQYAEVSFTDSATGTTSVNMVGTLTPYALTVSNSALAYTLGGPGQISGSVTLVKTGTNVLTLDDSGGNNFTSGIVVSNGILQVGELDSKGNLGQGPISLASASSVLYFNGGAESIIPNIISGAGSVVQGGSGTTLQFGEANTFTGNLLVTNGSTLQGNAIGTLGASSGTLIVASGSTFDAHGVGTSRSIVTSGAGVSANGAIINTGGPIYDSSGGLTPSLTLTGNTTLGFSSRWDLGSSTGATLSTGGQNYNLTLLASGYFEFRDVRMDTNLGNIFIAAGNMGYTGSTSAGNPTNSLTLADACTLTFYNDDGFNATLNKQVVLQDGGTIQNGGGASTISGPLIVTNANSTYYGAVNVGGTSLTLSGNISGTGGLLMENNSGQLNITGNASAFTGGILIYGGNLDLTGTIGSGITNYTGDVEGSGTCVGTLDISGDLIPGTPSTAGTLTANGLVLEAGANAIFNLGTVATAGQGFNSFVQVNGTLIINGNVLYLNPLAPLAQGSTYTLLACANLIGAFSQVTTETTTPYTFTLSTTNTSSNTLVQVTVTGGGPSTKVWNNNSGDGEWDVDSSQNWSNLTTHAALDYFYTLDSAVFDDSIVNSPNPSTSIDIASGVVITPSAMTNNSTNNYTISGAGTINGTTGLVKLGSGTLTINTVNSFTGNITIGGGTLLADTVGALGTTAGTIYVTNGGTLDLGFGLGAKPLVLAGAGVGGAGALVNSAGSPIYDNFNGAGGLTNVTISGNTTIGGNTRIDFGQFTPFTGVVNSGGSNYSLSVLGITYREWDNVIFDTNFGNINVMTSQGGAVGIKGITSLGNPTNNLAVFSNAIVDLYEDNTLTPNANVSLNKSVLLYGGSSLVNGGGTNALLAPVTLSTNRADVCTITVNSGSLTINGPIVGPGSLALPGFNPLYLAGTNTYTGSTTITGGTVYLTNNGSISGSTNITVTSVLDASGRSDKTVTLTSGQTLQGSGRINGNLTVSPGAAVLPGSVGVISALTITNAVTLSGTTYMEVIKQFGQADTITCASINYGGILVVSNLAGTLVPGDSFKLFNTTNGSGAFTAIVPSPGSGLQWNTNQLATNGTITVATGGSPSVPSTIGHVAYSSGNLFLSGSNGLPNQTFYILASTNLTAPIANWALISTNSFDANGNFNIVTQVGTSYTQEFFILYEGLTPP